MGSRLNLQGLLQALIADADGHVYFQPPPNIEMIYPAIVYNRDHRQANFADNIPYATKTRWQITVIDRNPDSAIPDRVAEMSMSTYVRHFTTEGLNHDIYYVYY